MHWKDYWVALDTETTGFGRDARILELSIIEFVGGEPVDERSWLFCPRGVLWESEGVQKALSVNGLTRAMLTGQPTFESQAEKIRSELSKASTWVAHNIEFDFRMLNQEFQIASVPTPRPDLLACTQQLDMYLDQRSRGWKLNDVAGRRGVPPQEPAHRAASDARRCGLIFSKMLPELPDDLKEVSRILERRRKGSW